MKIPSCADITRGSSLYFTQYIKAEQYDSAKLLLDYWEDKCDITEPIFRATVMMTLLENKNTDSLINSSNIELINSHWYNRNNIYYFDYYYGEKFTTKTFDSFSVDFFKVQLAQQEKGSTNYALCEYYSGNADSFFLRIQDNLDDSSNLSKQYKRYIDKYINLAETNMAGVMGVWIPTGGVTHLGSHPILGFQLGAKYKRYNADLELSFKFIRSKTPYYAQRVSSDNSIELTDKFFGGYIGLNLGYDMIRIRQYEIQLLGGVAADGFDALDTVDEGKSTELKAETIWTYNFNFGLGYRYYLTGFTYIGVQAKYNIVDYSLGGVVNFTGNPVTVTFLVGGLGNYTKKQNLERMQYKIRQ